MALREELGSVGLAITTPSNAAIVLSQLGFAYVKAMAFVAGFQFVTGWFSEAQEIISAYREKRRRRWLADSLSESDYAKGHLEQQVILTVIFYAWYAWLISAILIVFGFLVSWTARRLLRYLKLSVKRPEYLQLTDPPEDHTVGVYLKRMLQSGILVMIFMVAYLLGPLRLHSIQWDDPVHVTVGAQKLTGALIYRLHDGVILNVETCGYVFVGDQGLVIWDQESQEMSDGTAGGTLELCLLGGPVRPGRGVLQHHPATLADTQPNAVVQAVSSSPDRTAILFAFDPRPYQDST